MAQRKHEKKPRKRINIAERKEHLMPENQTTTLDQLVDELKEYKTGGGKIPPMMIDRIIGVLSQQRLRIRELEAAAEKGTV